MDQAWFWTDEWQAKEREADEDIAAGRTIRYESDEDFLAALRDIDESSPEPMDQVAAQMTLMRDTDPDSWADYLAEGRAWEEGTSERLDS